MKKVILPLIALFLFTGTIQAQDATHAFKDAKKDYNKFNLEDNPTNKEEVLLSARENIDIAAANPDAFSPRKQFTLWDLKSSIYNALAKSCISNRILNPEYKLDIPNPALEAYSAEIKALSLSDKTWQKASALEAMTLTAGYLLKIGNHYNEDQDYKDTYLSFKTALDARTVLLENGNNVFLPTKDEYRDQVFLTAVCAFKAKENAAAMTYFQQLYDIKYNDPIVYSNLFQLLVSSDETKALKTLNEGREKFPYDQRLLETEINYYASRDKLNILTDKLKTAIAAEPDNTTIIQSLGNVFENLQRKELEAGNAAKAEEYALDAVKYYKLVLEKNPNAFDATYKIGTVYLNKTEALKKEMKTMENDFSPSAIAAYDKKKVEVISMYDKALSYFKKAEKLIPNDLGTLAALIEIFTYKKDISTSEQFKMRVETIKAGGGIESSYFKQ